MPLMSYVRSLEGKDNTARGDAVLKELDALHISPLVQCSHVLSVRNIVVDFGPPGDGGLPVFCAHYDAVKGSPGAADNASGVAVLLGLCSQMTNRRVPLRVIFFDREEAWLRTPLFRLGLLGSLHYAGKADLCRINAVYNLESCGSGDCLGIWPVKNEGRGLAAVETVEMAAGRLGLRVFKAHVPWYLFTSDHQSFRWHGLANSISLSLLAACDETTLREFASGHGLKNLLRSRTSLPEPLRSIHTSADTSDRLSEGSLGLMLSLLLSILEG